MLQAYRPDLSSYCSPPNPELPHVLSIGWLDSHHSFPTGGVPSEFVQKLTALYCEEIPGSAIARTGGEYYCPFGCQPERITCEGGRWRGPFGIGEVWVPSHTYVLYCAPGLLIHYIQKHEYRPPSCFIDAVMAITAATRFDADIARLQSLAFVKGKLLQYDDLVRLSLIKAGDPMPWNKLPPLLQQDNLNRN